MFLFIIILLSIYPLRLPKYPPGGWFFGGNPIQRWKPEPLEGKWQPPRSGVQSALQQSPDLPHNIAAWTAHGVVVAVSTAVAYLSRSFVITYYSSPISFKFFSPKILHRKTLNLPSDPTGIQAISSLVNSAIKILYPFCHSLMHQSNVAKFIPAPQSLNSFVSAFNSSTVSPTIYFNPPL